VDGARRDQGRRGGSQHLARRDAHGRGTRGAVGLDSNGWCCRGRWAS
jgi:hypothetical protein